MLFFYDYGDTMEIRLKRSKPVEVYERDTDSNYEVSKRRAMNIPSGNDTLFEMLVDLSISDGLTCGECYGFQCRVCWRGVAVAYAIMNTPFFEWLHRHKCNSGVVQILNGISQINSKKV